MKNEGVELFCSSSSQFPSNAVFNRVQNNGEKAVMMLENRKMSCVV